MMIKKIILILLISLPCFAEEIVKIKFSTTKPISQEVVQQHNLQYGEINQRAGKYLYWGVLDEKDITELGKEVKIICAHNKKGFQVGRTKILSAPATYDKDGIKLTDDVYTETGTVKHTFDKAEYLSLMRDIKTYSPECVELTSERPTEVKETHNIFGWERAQIPKEVKEVSK